MIIDKEFVDKVVLQIERKGEYKIPEWMDYDKLLDLMQKIDDWLSKNKVGHKKELGFKGNRSFILAFKKINVSRKITKEQLIIFLDDYNELLKRKSCECDLKKNVSVNDEVRFIDNAWDALVKE